MAKNERNSLSNADRAIAVELEERLDQSDRMAEAIHQQKLTQESESPQSEVEFLRAYEGTPDGFWILLEILNWIAFRGEPAPPNRAEAALLIRGAEVELRNHCAERKFTLLGVQAEHQTAREIPWTVFADAIWPCWTHNTIEADDAAPPTFVRRFQPWLRIRSLASDVKAHWPSPTSARSENAARSQRIGRFTRCQEKRRNWISLRDIAEWFATPPRTMSEAYDLLRRDMESGLFEEQGKSLVLYLVPELRAQRYTRDMLKGAFAIDYHGNASTAPTATDFLKDMWVPRRIAENWFADRRLGPLPNRLKPASGDASGDQTRRPTPIGTGLPGRPTQTNHLIQDELDRRIAAGSQEDSLKKQAEVLLTWLKSAHSDLPRPTVGTIKNAIRTKFRAQKPRN